jgi:hypothetical protein
MEVQREDREGKGGVERGRGRGGRSLDCSPSSGLLLKNIFVKSSFQNDAETEFEFV